MPQKTVAKTTKNVRLFDVSCRLLYVAAVDESLLEHGSGFLMHVLEQEALRLLKEGKAPRDFHLSVVEALPLRSQREPTTAAQVEALLLSFMQYVTSDDAATNLVAEGGGSAGETNRQIVANFLARRTVPITSSAAAGTPTDGGPAPESEE